VSCIGSCLNRSGLFVEALLVDSTGVSPFMVIAARTTCIVLTLP
jgi:hypothetical protein